MTEAVQDLANYRLKRARESLEEAKILAQAKHWNACVNRLYYTCFYIVSALLILDNLSSSKHTGIRSFFNLHYVKTERVSKQVATIYSDLFERRQEGDYFDFLEFQESQVRPLIPKVEEFIECLNNLLEEKIKEQSENSDTQVQQ